MTTNSERAPRRRLLLTVAIVAVLVAIVAVGFAVYLAARGDGGNAAPAPTSDVETPAPTGTGVDACFGGEELSAAALFTAQREAPHTPEGAVSYVAAFARYTYQAPLPQDIDDVASANALGATTWAEWAAAVDGWTGPVPFSTTTATGSYRIQSYTPDEAVITVVLPMVVDGAITTRTFVPTITVGRTAAGVWSVSSIDNSAAENRGRLSDSTDFVGGC